MYYLNSRFYDPVIGRFISPDSIGGLNLYAYCGNNPVMYCDPSGCIPKWLAWALSGAAIIVCIALCATGVGDILGGVLIGAGLGGISI